MSETTHSILHSARHFLFGTLLSRCSGFFRDMTMAFCFGSTPEVASFMVAYRLANLFRRLFGEGNAQSGFIPPFERLRAQEPKSAFIFYRDAAWSMGLILIAAVVLLEGLFAFLKPAESDWRTITQLAMWMVPGLFFICLHALHGALLQCQKKAFWTGAAPVAFNAAWIGAALLAARSAEPMPLLALGITLAYGLQWLFTARIVRIELRPHLTWREWLRPKLFSSEFRAMARAMMLGILGVGATQINAAIDAIFSKLADPSGPAYLWYAIRVEQLPLALFGVALAGALLPPLARAATQAPKRVYGELLGGALRHALALMIPCTFGLIALAPVGLNLLYGHGHFTMSDVLATAECLVAYTLGLIPAVGVLVLAQGFYGQKTYSIPTIGSLLAVAINLALNGALVFGAGLGAVSIALATSASAWGNLWFLKRALVHIGVRTVLVERSFLWRLCVCSALPALLAWGTYALWSSELPRGVVAQAVQLSICGSLYLGGVLTFARYFKINELFELARRTR